MFLGLLAGVVRLLVILLILSALLILILILLILILRLLILILILFVLIVAVLLLLLLLLEQFLRVGQVVFGVGVFRSLAQGLFVGIYGFGVGFGLHVGVAEVVGGMGAFFSGQIRILQYFGVLFRRLWLKALLVLRVAEVINQAAVRRVEREPFPVQFFGRGIVFLFVEAVALVGQRDGLSVEPGR